MNHERPNPLNDLLNESPFRTSIKKWGEDPDADFTAIKNLEQRIKELEIKIAQCPTHDVLDQRIREIEKEEQVEYRGMSKDELRLIHGLPHSPPENPTSSISESWMFRAVIAIITVFVVFLLLHRMGLAQDTKTMKAKNEQPTIIEQRFIEARPIGVRESGARESGVRPIEAREAGSSDRIVAGSNAKAVITDSNGNTIPDQVPIGEVIYFSARSSTKGNGSQSIKWIVKPEARASRSREFEDGQLLVVPTGTTPLRLTIIQVVALGDTVDVAEISVNVGEIQPNPVPPTPGPNPQPTVRPWTKLIEGLKAPSDSAKRQAVSGVFSGIADKIKSGSITTIDQLMTETGKGLIVALPGNALQEWIPWRDSISDGLESLGDQIKFADHEQIWRDVAKSLK